MATGGDHVVVAGPFPAVAVPIGGGGSATQPVRLNETTATTSTATTHRHGVIDRAIASPPLSRAGTIVGGFGGQGGPRGAESNAERRAATSRATRLRLRARHPLG